MGKSVFRGLKDVRLAGKYERGKTIRFPNFTASSMEVTKAIKFAKNQSKRTGGTILYMLSITGKLISDYSIYKS